MELSAALGHTTRSRHLLSSDEAAAIKHNRSHCTALCLIARGGGVAMLPLGSGRAPLPSRSPCRGQQWHRTMGAFFGFRPALPPCAGATEPSGHRLVLPLLVPDQSAEQWYELT